ncbi:MAG: HAMP domain-containing sensor histidine kinase [Eubacteriales bacterium]|nr:HAMP domain-containing sensor histidine kinase [Eubacteriales bacterium]
MKNKLLLKIVIVTTIALLISTGISIGVLYYINLTTVKDNLTKANDTISSDIANATDRGQVEEYVFDVNNHIVGVCVLDGKDEIIANSIEYGLLSDETLKKKICKATREKHTFSYIKQLRREGKTVLVKCTLVNNPAIDPSKELIVVTSTVFFYNSSMMRIVIVFALAVLLVVFVGANIIINSAIKVAVEPIGEVGNSLKEIVNGNYKKANIVSYGDEEIDNLFGQIGEISDQISNSVIELRQEQSKSRFLLKAVNQGVMAISKMGTVMLTNSVVNAIFEQDDMSGASVEEYFAPDAVAKIKKAVNDKTTAEVLVERNSKIYLVEAIPFDDESELEFSNIKMILVFTDVTQPFNAEKIRNEFFANASHELKTPLTAIVGYSEILQMHSDPKTIDKCASEINKNAQKMRELINDMLKLSRLEAQQEVEESKKFELLQLCKKTVEEQKDVADNKNVSVRVEGVEAYIVGKEDMIKTVVENLLNNAIKYNKEGGKVVVSVQENENSVIMSVADNGIGIAKEHHDRLFERFYKVDVARTRTEESSTGLGLAIVKHILQMHDAKITVESQPDVGTKMTVTFKKAFD